MYNQWLYFFNSPLKIISVKNKKEKQEVKKEWLDDGNMKISGNKPSEWSVVLQPMIYEDIPTVEHNINEDKLESLYLITRAFKYKDSKLFDEGEKLQDKYNKKKEEIETIFSKNSKLLKDVLEKKFEIQRKIYLDKLKNKNVTELTKKLDNITIESIEILQKINEEKFVLKSQSVLTNGPFPDPPITKYLSLKSKIYKLDENENKGSIKVIKLS